MKKIILIVTILAMFVIILAAFISFSSSKETDKLIGEEISKDKIKEFNVTAKKFSFEPDTVDVNKGDAIRLKITSADVTHGFSLKEFDVNVKIEPGKISTVEFIADKKGEFTFYCSVFCGLGHGKMKGKLIVN